MSKVHVHGVMWREGKGIPSIIKQSEVQDSNEVETFRNTIKMEVLEGDAKMQFRTTIQNLIIIYLQYLMKSVRLHVGNKSAAS